MAELIYSKDSIGISVTIKIAGVTITTSYAAAALMSNAAANYGKALLSVVDSTGVAVSDLNGLLLTGVVMNRGTTDGTAVYTISYGLAVGEYYAIPVYGVKNAAGNFEWQKQSPIPISVRAQIGTPTMVY